MADAARPPPQPQHIRIFLSSPGDVAEERELARRILKDELPTDPFLRGRLTFDAVSWDDPAAPNPMPATNTPQEAVNRFGPKPSECDVVVVVLWSRLGTHLDVEAFHRPDDTPYLSGTEWEFEDAWRGCKAHGRPEILVYRRTEEPVATLGAPDWEERRRQYRRVGEFFRRFENPDGSLQAGWTGYANPAQFRNRLAGDLRQLLHERMETMPAAADKGVPAAMLEASGPAAASAGTGAVAPAPQPLTKADLGAVHGFQPGKLLGRMAALLALGILALAQMGAFDLVLRDVLGVDVPHDPLLRFAVLGALPAAVVAAQLLVEWRAQAQARRIRARTVAVAEAKERHFRVGPYEAMDWAAFHRADSVHEMVLCWLLAASEGVVPLYLTGDSGTGKSSLLAAHVVPKLRESAWTVVQARTYGDPETQLRAALASHLSPKRRGATVTAELPPTRALLEAAARRVPRPGRLLVLLDQFEEFVILHEPAAREGFAALLRDLIAQPVPGLVLLLVLRSEYKAHLEELGLPPLRLGGNWKEVPRFTLAAARRFLEEGRLGLKPEATDALVAGAARLDDTPGLVRPITINLLGHILAEGERIRPEGLDAGRLMLSYVRQAIEHPDVRHLMPRLLPRLITEAGTKVPATEAALASRSGLKPAEARACLMTLAQRALARPLDARQATWELSHDFVARLVGQALGRLRADRLRRALGYAAPALLVLTVGGVAGAVAWNETAENRARASLQEAGIHLEERGDGALAVQAVTRTATSTLPQAQRAIRRLSSRIVEANLSRLELLQCEGGQTCFPQLRAFTLREGTATPVDLAPLAGLAGLRELVLSGNPVADLAPLAGLAALQTLRLKQTSVTDLAPLAGLAGLRELDLSGTRVADLAPLAGLAGLRELDLSGTRVADLAPLAGLAALQTLDLSGATRVADLAPLAGLAGLRDLHLSFAPVTDLAPLAGLAGLQALDLSNTPITDLAPLAGLAALRDLRLSFAPVTDLAPLAGLAGLRELDLSGTSIGNLAPLRQIELRVVHHVPRAALKLPPGAASWRLNTPQ